MEFEHFSHEHPLVFKKEHNNDGEDVYCNGCQQPMWGPSYGCISCEFFLHKSCADLPREMTHPIHPSHPLTLFPDHPFGVTNCCCDACGAICEGFIHLCSTCYNCFDIICISTIDKIQKKIQHRSHKHPLISLQSPALFLCFACGTEHRGASYLCSTCRFWINQKCASVPTTIKCSDHHHPLTLTYFLPDEYYQFRPDCDICRRELKRPYWVYYCVGCRYFSHVNWATSKVELSRDCETEVEVEDVDSNLITLPFADESVDHPMTLFIKHVSLQGMHKKAAEISHSSHDHPLVFVDKVIENESYSDNKRPLLNEVKYDEICNGCAKPILAPFYHCAQCNFFLHECCAELHNELCHPCHPKHRLSLIAPETPNFHPRNCDCCSKFCNVFMFGCSTCEFYLDIQCASLPHIIRHEAHKGTLGLRKITNVMCSTCNGNVFGFMFTCKVCFFNLCYLCALLPSKIRHRYDKHPFLLSYSPIENHPEEYYCEICEREINPKRWFYHCVDCDQSLHTGCIHPQLADEYSNVKFGGTPKVDKHPQHLTYVRYPKKYNPRGPSCYDCGKLFDHIPIAFECLPCNFRIHYNCAFDLESEYNEL